MYIKFDFILENNTFEFTFLQTVVKTLHFGVSLCFRVWSHQQHAPEVGVFGERMEDDDVQDHPRHVHLPPGHRYFRLRSQRGGPWKRIWRKSKRKLEWRK